MEHLQGIKTKLGMESDGKDKLIEKFKEWAASLKMPEGIRKVFEEELAKLQGLEPAASEANVMKNYMDWLTQVWIHLMHSFYLWYFLDPCPSYRAWGTWVETKRVPIFYS